MKVRRSKPLPRYSWDWFGRTFNETRLWDRQQHRNVATTVTAADAQMIVDALNRKAHHEG